MVLAQPLHREMVQQACVPESVQLDEAQTNDRQLKESGDPKGDLNMLDPSIAGHTSSSGGFDQCEGHMESLSLRHRCLLFRDEAVKKTLCAKTPSKFSEGSQRIAVVWQTYGCGWWEEMNRARSNTPGRRCTPSLHCLAVSRWLLKWRCERSVSADIEERLASEAVSSTKPYPASRQRHYVAT